MIKTVYYAEMEDILKKHAGAKWVIIFDHKISADDESKVRGLLGRCEQKLYAHTWVQSGIVAGQSISKDSKDLLCTMHKITGSIDRTRSLGIFIHVC